MQPVLLSKLFFNFFYQLNSVSKEYPPGVCWIISVINDFSGFSSDEDTFSSSYSVSA